MATLTQIGGNMTFLTVINGKFAQRVSEHSENAEKRTNKNGKIIYERYYKTAEGIISKLEIRELEHEGKKFKSFNITLDNEVQIQLSGGIDNIQNKNIINALLTAKIDAPIRFVSTKDDEGYSRVFPMQFEKGLKWFSTKDHPRGVPMPKKKKVAGEEKWDWDNQNEWFFNKFQELSEKVSKNTVTSSTEAQKKQLNEDVNPDDIPF